MDKDAYIKELEDQNENLREKLVDAEQIIELSDSYNAVGLRQTIDDIRESFDDHQTYDLYCKLVTYVTYMNIYNVKIHDAHNITCEVSKKYRDCNFSVKITLMVNRIPCRKYFFFSDIKEQEKLYVEIKIDGVLVPRHDMVFEESLIERFKNMCRERIRIDTANQRDMVYR
jgi:hypothetical protein